MEARELPTILQDTLDRYAMFAPNQTVVVGVSGGPDSVALLHALAGLRDARKIRLVAAHLNHGFRGAEADADADYVAALAASLEISCVCETVDVPALKKRRHLSSQEAAREVRHAFLRRVAQQQNADRIALGHTQDDRIETVLLNLLRGAGLEGLQGFPPIAPPIIRPLYAVRRIQTEAYCAAFDLNPRRDSSNDKTDYRRNRIRLELLPHLAAHYNPNVQAALLRLSERAAADDALLDSLTENAFDSCRVYEKEYEKETALDGAKLSELPVALQRRVLRFAIARLRGTLQNIAAEPTEAVLRHNSERKDGFVDAAAGGRGNPSDFHAKRRNPAGANPTRGRARRSAGLGSAADSFRPG